MTNQFSHYYKDVSKLQTVDVYRVLELFNVVNPSIQHAVKKLLVAGGRGSKDMAKDVREAIVSLERWEAMRNEDIQQPALDAEHWQLSDVVQANNRIYDLLLGDDAQAYKEAYRYLERSDPQLYAELMKAVWRREVGKEAT